MGESSHSVAKAGVEDEIPKETMWSQRQSSGQHLGNISIQRVAEKGREREAHGRDQKEMS